MEKTVLTIPITKKEKGIVKKCSEEYGLTMSSFVRLLIKKYIKEEGAKIDDGERV